MKELWLGDCMQMMESIPSGSVDMILCDLPYGVTSLGWDSVLRLDALWAQYKRIRKPSAAIVLFASQPFTTDLIQSNRNEFKYSLVWNKNVPTGMAQATYQPMKYHEDIVVFCGKKPTYNPIMKKRTGVGKACYNYDHYCGDSNHVKLDKVKYRYDPDWVQPSTVLDFKVVPNRSGKLHPTQKPVDLCEYLIATYTNEGDLVVDNCAGSGTTLVAAQNIGRRFIGIEKDEDYYKAALSRLTGSRRAI